MLASRDGKLAADESDRRRVVDAITYVEEITVTEVQGGIADLDRLIRVGKRAVITDRDGSARDQRRAGISLGAMQIEGARAALVQVDVTRNDSREIGVPVDRESGLSGGSIGDGAADDASAAAGSGARKSGYELALSIQVQGAPQVDRELLIEEQRIHDAARAQPQRAAVDVSRPGDELLGVDVQLSRQILRESRRAGHPAVQGEGLSALDMEDAFVSGEGDDGHVEEGAAAA